MVDVTTKIFSFLHLLIIPFYIGGILFSEDMNLDLAIDYALKNSTTMKLATEEKKIAYSQSVEARSAALPMLSGIASGSRNFMIAEQVVKFGDEPPVSIKFGQDNQAIYGLSATQTIFEGRVFSAIRASKVYDNITEFAFKVSTLGVEEQTITAFYSVLVSVKVMEVMKSDGMTELLVMFLNLSGPSSKVICATRFETSIDFLKSGTITIAPNFFQLRLATSFLFKFFCLLCDSIECSVPGPSFSQFNDRFVPCQ